MSSQHNLIGKFLGCRRIAVIGVSRDARDFSRKLWNEFTVRGYDAVPVHPAQSRIDDVQCFPTVGSISPAPGAALVLVSGDRRKKVLEECLAAGVRLVWIY